MRNLNQKSDLSSHCGFIRQTPEAEGKGVGFCGYPHYDWQRYTTWFFK